MSSSKKREDVTHRSLATTGPQFYFRTTDVTGEIQLEEGVEMVMPGDNTVMNVELIQPIAMDEGLNFAIREGGRTVGAGVVTEIVEIRIVNRRGRGSFTRSCDLEESCATISDVGLR